MIGGTPDSRADSFNSGTNLHESVSSIGPYANSAVANAFIGGYDSNDEYRTCTDSDSNPALPGGSSNPNSGSEN